MNALEVMTIAAEMLEKKYGEGKIAVFNRGDSGRMESNVTLFSEGEWESTPFQQCHGRKAPVRWLYEQGGNPEMAAFVDADGSAQVYSVDAEQDGEGDWTIILKHEDATDAYPHIANALRSYGDRFTGGAPGILAKEWFEAGFSDADEVDYWCEIGVWEPTVAKAFKDAGLSAPQVKEGAEMMLEDLGKEEFTDGCPIYAICNGDYNLAHLVELVKEHA